MQLVSILRNAAGRLGVDFGVAGYPPAQAVVLLDPATGLPRGGADSGQYVEPLGTPSVPRQITATAASANTVLTATCRRISIKARTSDVRYAVGAVAQTASATLSHYIEAGERLDMAVPAGAHIAVIRDLAATVNAVVEITELA